MYRRWLSPLVAQRLTQFPAVALLGPRQVGKTTLALALTRERPSLYLDLERPADLQKLEDPEWFLRAQEERLVVLDEVQRMPGLFGVLRGLIDEDRRAGRRTGRFLLLGSASRDLLSHSGESLAGRVAYLELTPFHALEVAPDDPGVDALWVRGGFPESWLAPDDAASRVWRDQFLRTYLERDLPQFGFRFPAATMRRLWTMLAHRQGALLNASELGRALGISSPTVSRYLEALEDLMLLRRLPPWSQHRGKRLVRSPRIYWRDSGLLHALLDIPDREALFGHPVFGASWEGFVIEQLLSALPEASAQAHFYRTATGVEMDLVLEWTGGALWAIEVKRGQDTAPSSGFYRALDDLRPERAFVVHAGTERRPLSGERAEAIGWRELQALVAEGR